MQKATSDYTLCNNDAAAQSVHATMTDWKIIAVDCEGKKLGTKNGQLSLITVCTIPSPGVESGSTFIFDVLGLSKVALRPLFDILESESVVKVMFDGRKDFSALYHEQSVTLRNVLDMQIADVTSRKVKGESTQDQLSRLWPYLSRGEVQGHPKSYAFVHMLSGLNKCLEHHGILVGDSMKVSSHDEWLKRPLPTGHLSYAANDATMIALLHQHFVQAQLINPQLGEQSSRYITRYRGAQPSANDPYIGHPLLPLEILDVESGSRRRCKECHRDLCRASFSLNAWKNSDKRQCFVCRAISTKRQTRFHRAPS
ncbi:ribonuclease H-like domain-containing protein [Mycena floridula]|nr:ribonuclease H-like domain-containing protein [Mycena floridula]